MLRLSDGNLPTSRRPFGYAPLPKQFEPTRSMAKLLFGTRRKAFRVDRFFCKRAVSAACLSCTPRSSGGKGGSQLAPPRPPLPFACRAFVLRAFYFAFRLCLFPLRPILASLAGGSVRVPPPCCPKGPWARQEQEVHPGYQYSKVPPTHPTPTPPRSRPSLAPLKNPAGDRPGHPATWPAFPVRESQKVANAGPPTSCSHRNSDS